MTKQTTPTAAGLKLLNAVVDNGGFKRHLSRLAGTSIASQWSLIRDGYLVEVDDAEWVDSYGNNGLAISDKGLDAVFGSVAVEVA
jgi:hypothetical protein